MEGDEIEGLARKRELSEPLTLPKLSSGLSSFGFNPLDPDVSLEDPYDVENTVDIEDIQKYVNCDLNEVGEEDQSALDKFKRKMVPIYPPNSTFENAQLLKNIKVKGAGGTPPPGSFVHVHYLYYTDLDEVPRDVSYLRRKQPEYFQLGVDNLLPAYSIAIESMERGEKSDFFASYEICFGEIGCQPRIPEKADLLFEIELFDFSLIDNKNIFSNTPLTFDSILKRAEELSSFARTLANENNTSTAIKRYNEAVNLLMSNKIDISSDEEQYRLEEYTCKLYRNLMVCCNRLEKYKQSCLHAKNAINFSHQFAKKDVKLWFLWGKALNGLHEWPEALKKLKNSLKLDQTTSCQKQIEEEITKAQRGLYFDRKNSQSMYAKMFVHRNVEHDKEPCSNTDVESKPNIDIDKLECFRNILKIELSEFRMKDGEDTLNLGESDTYSIEEINIFKQLAKEIDLKMTTEGNVVFTK